MNTQEKAYNNAVNSCRSALYKSGIQNESKAMRKVKTGSNVNAADNTTQNCKTGIDTATIGLQLKEAVDAIFDPTTGMTEEQKKSFVEKIYKKLESGKKLTYDELQYLRLHDPITYAKAARVQVMREVLKRQLENAKSKEEAADIYLTNMSRIADDDPAKKELEAAYNDEYSEFKKSDDYKKLPDTRKEAKEKEKDKDKEVSPEIKKNEK